MSIRTTMAACLERWSGTGGGAARSENKKPSLESPDRDGSMHEQHPQQPKAPPVATLAGYQSSIVTNFAQAKSP